MSEVPQLDLDQLSPTSNEQNNPSSPTLASNALAQ